LNGKRTAHLCKNGGDFGIFGLVFDRTEPVKDICKKNSLLPNFLLEVKDLIRLTNAKIIPLGKNDPFKGSVK
jgi:hypothetical protein